jgi:hypothetical protein
MMCQTKRPRGMTNLEQQTREWHDIIIIYKCQKELQGGIHKNYSREY